MKKLKTIFRIDPREVKMPLIMIFFGLSALFVSIYSRGFMLNVMYWFISLLPIFIPFTTLSLVLRKYKGKRKNNLLKRMLITSSLGFFMISIYFLKPEWKHTLLIIISSGGLLYFLYDYILQGNLYFILKNKPAKILKNDVRFEKVMETKCSRNVLHEYIKKMGRRKRYPILQKFKKHGYKTTHLFPTSKTSLLEIIINFIFKTEFHF